MKQTLKHIAIGLPIGYVISHLFETSGNYSKHEIGVYIVSAIAGLFMGFAIEFLQGELTKHQKNQAQFSKADVLFTTLASLIGSLAANEVHSVFLMWGLIILGLIVGANEIRLYHKSKLL